MLVMGRVRHAAIVASPMTARSRPKQCGQNIQKNRWRTTVAEPGSVAPWSSDARSARNGYGRGLPD